MSVTESAVDDRRHTSAWLLLIGVAFTVGASTTYMVLRAAFGDRPAHINVRWSPATTPDAQQRLEQQYHLTYGQRTEGRTFSYDLTDLSRNNIRAMVLDPNVEDTHYIHRTAYRIWRFAPRSQYHDGGEKWGPLLEATVVAFGLIAAIAFVLAVGERVLPPRLAARIPLRTQFIHPRGAVASLLQSIVGRIPAGSAEQVAVLRIVLGVALLALFLQQRVAPAFVFQSANVLTSLHQWLLAPFVRAPNLTQWILPWLLVWSVLFIAGAASRLSYLMLTLGAFAWATVLTTRLGYHMVSALLVALLCLIPSRWGDTWSVDAWWRRRQLRLPATTGSPQEYGYSIWMPGVVVGVIFAAAAVAKLHESGIAWILNGTVKYHFLSDAASAPLDWGLRVGLYPKLAVALSFAAILIEAAIVFGSFARKYVYRAIAGIAGVALLGGFALFQGLFWPAWWLLLISFLPWHRFASRSTVAATNTSQADARRMRLQPVIVIALIAQQLIVSALRLEAGPAVSTYGMYSNTYDSPEAYESQSTTSYWLTSSDGRQCNVTESAARAVASARSGSGDASARDAVQRCFGTTDVSRVEAEQRRARIDWKQWRPAGVTRLSLSASSASNAAQ
ncbi:MAG TPA: hypothetical protein VFU28_23640 [Vicinamibacterales bacterium]|nr:hypothetical protein [Vicinamibacterales bacterium]